MLARLRANPRPFALMAVGLFLVIGFFVVVAPLFDTSGAPQAELDGVLPVSAAQGQQLSIDLAMDNTGVSVIAPTCVRATVQGPLRPLGIVFQGLDHEAFHSGRACGGSLSGGETISLVLLFQPTGSGSARVDLTPAQGSRTIGSTLGGTVQVR